MTTRTLTFTEVKRVTLTPSSTFTYRAHYPTYTSIMQEGASLTTLQDTVTAQPTLTHLPTKLKTVTRISTSTTINTVTLVDGSEQTTQLDTRTKVDKSTTVHTHTEVSTMRAVSTQTVAYLPGVHTMTLTLTQVSTHPYVTYLPSTTLVCESKYTVTQVDLTPLTTTL